MRRPGSDRLLDPRREITDGTGRKHFGIACLIGAMIAGVVWGPGARAAAAQKKRAANDSGIAARHPGDRGIERDSRVVFAEKFNAKSIAGIARRWEAVKGKTLLTLSDDVPVKSADPKSLLITHVGGQGDGAHLYRRLEPGHDKLHVRFYVKFDRGCAPIHHFFHVGGCNPPTAWPQGGAGERPRGDDRFSTGVEPFGKRWCWDYYSYWMEMRGSPPRGKTWGNSFIHDPKLQVKRGKWICVELMMKMNDVGESNGEMALWIDGRQVSRLGPGFPKGRWVYDKFQPGRGGRGVRWNDATGGPERLVFPGEGKPFGGFRWRSDRKLNLNFLWLLCYITRAPRGRVSKIRFDNIVVAREYIGPIG